MTLIYFTARLNLVTYAFLWEKVRIVDFSETIAASDLKVGRSRHLGEFMKVIEYWRSRSFLDPGPRSCTYKNSNRIFSEATVAIWTKFFMKAFRYKETKIWWHDAGHMTKMASTPIYCKTLQKSSSPDSAGWFPRNLVCSIGDSTPSKFVQLMTLGWPWPILRHGQILWLWLYCKKKWRKWIFLKLLQHVTLN